MSASQYYSATAYVGTPQRHEVEVTIPLVGPAGPAGEGGGAPAGGTAGQMLRKVSATDYDTEWSSRVTSLEASSTANISGALGLQVQCPTAGGSSAVGLLGTVVGGSPQARIYGAGTTGALTTIATFAVGGATLNTGTLKLTDPTGGETAEFSAANLSGNRIYTLTDDTGRLPALQVVDQSLTPYPYSPGVPGQMVFTNAGRLYLCFAANRWRSVLVSDGATDVVKNVTGLASTNVFTSTAHGFVAGNRIRFSLLNSGTASVGGLFVDRVYYIATVPTANSFTISEFSLLTPTFDLTADLVATSQFTSNEWDD
jgi:hypothetical protein